MCTRSSKRLNHRLAACILMGFWGPSLFAESSLELSKARALTVGCLGCHGGSGEGQGSLPPLKTLDRTTFIQKFEAYASPTQSSSVMHRIAKGYVAEEIRQMAALLARDSSQ